MVTPTVGATVNVLINPGHSPTTATIVSVDPIRRTVVVNQTSGAIASQQGVTMSMDHVKLQNDFQAPRCVGAFWVW